MQSKEITLKNGILKILATGRREVSDGLQICLTSEMLALILKRDIEEVTNETKRLISDGLLYRPFCHDQRFVGLTIEGQKDQPVHFAT